MVTLGIVGAGRWGQNHIRVALELQREGALDGIIVCDTDPARLKRWEGEAKTTTSLAELAERASAAVIATPADTHSQLASQLLGEGIHVLVEKPMTIAASEARHLAGLAGQRELVLMPGHIFRYHPAIRELRKRIESRRFGEVELLSVTRMAASPPRPDVGVLYSLGIHEADLYPHLLGLEYPEAARADFASFHDPKIEEVASIVFRFPRGCLGTALESWVAPPGIKRRHLVVVGTKGSAEVDFEDTREMSSSSAEGSVERVHLDGQEPLRAEVEDFLKAIGGGGRHTPVADAGSGVRAVEIVESLRQTGSFVAPRGK